MVACSPQLFHIVYRADHRTRQSVNENGLVSGSPRHFWHPLYNARPGHVYLATGQMLQKIRNWGDRSCPVDVFAVNSSVLCAARVNPDEDWFMPDDMQPGNTVRGRHVLEVFGLEWPPNGWMWDWAKHLGLPALPSLGDWADALNLGSDPAQTRYSLGRGSIAYKGVIPPAALTLVFSTVPEVSS